MARRLPRLGVLALAFLAGCFASGDGTEPPPDRFNFPVGLAVSPGGAVLFAANSNFDLQWSGGTVEAYDLVAVRRDVVSMIQSPATFPKDRLVDPRGLEQCGVASPPQGSATTLGQQCAPPVRSETYFRNSATIGAFATDLQMSPDGRRLFIPVRGDASLTWLDVASDKNENPADPFRLDCGQGGERRCNAAHRAGNNPDEPGNTRRLTLPGEPFGLALSEQGDFALVTHQTQTKTSLLRTGAAVAGGPATAPSLQFVVDGVTNGGVGIAAVPHDPDAFPACLRTTANDPKSALRDPAACAAALPRPAFIQTSRAAAKIDLLRLYEDEGYQGDPSQPRRPFLQRERQVDVVANAGNFDSRGIAVDPTPRIACKARIGKNVTGAELDRQVLACARLPARVFVANRSPASLLIGTLGQEGVDGALYDPDLLSIKTSVPLSFGPSRVYLAPVVETDGTYGLRVFVVCFDASVIYVFDPNSNTVENIIRVGDGPFAMAFDPFDIGDVAKGNAVPFDSVSTTVRRFRFAYVAIFRNSHVQVLDLDNSVPKIAGKYTYQQIVYNLGEPTAPKGGL